MEKGDDRRIRWNKGEDGPHAGDAPMRTRLRTTAKYHSYNKHSGSRIRFLQAGLFNLVQGVITTQTRLRFEI